MNVTQVALENFKCYDDATLELDRGVTVVHGVNGSGKSTLLEAVFFALYGSKSLDGRTLAEVITTGEEEGGVELWFTHDGGAYHLERRLKRRGDRASTTTCILETPEGPIEGARDVRAAVTELLRMDADAFVNCAYVRQGEVNKLIHASPSDRQDMIDDLLQLGALEEYRERASDARLGVKDVLDEVRGQTSEIADQIEQKEQKDLHERRNGLKSERVSVTEKLEHYQAQQQNAEETLEAATDVLARHEETREEITQLTKTITDLREAVTETEREREALKSERRELQETQKTATDERVELLSGFNVDVGGVEDRLAELEAEDEELREQLEEHKLSIQEQTGEVERLRERAEELEAEGAQKRERAETLATKIDDDLEAIDDREEKLATLDERIEAAREQFEAVPFVFGEAEAHAESVKREREQLQTERTDITADIRTAKEAIDAGEDLLAEGKCPECGQPVEDSPHVDVLDDRRVELAELEAECEQLEAELETVGERLERALTLREAEREVSQLETNRENVSQLLSDKRETLTERRETCETLQNRAEELTEAAETNRERANEIDTAIEKTRAKLGSVNAERAALTSERQALERASELTVTVADVERDLERITEQRASKAKLNGERRERLAEKRDRKRELESAFDDERIEQARTEKENATTYLEQVGKQLTALRERRDNLQNAIGAVENELEELETLRERLSAATDRQDDLESVYEEALTLQQTYSELRAELRKQNVETLERLLNETFDLIYQNDSYAGIDLDGDYRLTVYQKDGQALEPEQLSGGERALFNLSLRCAIYRLLAEGVEGAAPMPPLILDEPTVFLDSGHVTQLVALVESMRTLGVEQIVLVSHDEELVGAADDLVRVEKDSTSNRARLEAGSGVSLEDLELLASD